MKGDGFPGGHQQLSHNRGRWALAGRRHAQAFSVAIGVAIPERHHDASARQAEVDAIGLGHAPDHAIADDPQACGLATVRR